MTDYTLLSPAIRALQALDRTQRAQALAAIRSLMASPDVDGVVKRALPPPYRPGTRGGDINGFHVIYTVQGEILLIHNISLGESMWMDDDDV